MATLADMIVRLQQVGEEIRAVAGDARSAAEEVEYLGRVEQEYAERSTTSSLTRAAGSPVGTMGAREGAGAGGVGVPKAVTATGTIAALKVTQGRLR